MTEKILARASEKSQLSPGENVWVNVDVLMTHDVCGPGAIGIFKKEFGEDAKVYILRVAIHRVANFEFIYPNEYFLLFLRCALSKMIFWKVYG